MSEKIQNFKTSPSNESIESLNEKNPFINWKTYFESVFDIQNTISPVDDNSLFFNFASEYLEKLMNLLNEIDVDDLSDYIEWFIINTFIKYTSMETREPVNEFKKYLGVRNNDMESLYSRDQFCMSKVEDMMGMALGKFFIERNFSDNIKNEGEKMVNYIKEAMLERIPQIEWLDKDTRDYAITKALKMIDNIGYPEYLMNPEKLSEKYREFETDPNDYFTTMINYDSYDFIKNLKLYQTPVITNELGMTPQTINAYYNFMNNSMNFPAGIFQLPLYSSNNPDYLNYGAIGILIGHELTHAFDNTGKNYDAEGKRTNWWSESSSLKYEELSQCFIDQYSNYYYEDENGIKHNVDGEKTLGENINDNGGLARAYEAWRKSLVKEQDKSSERNPKLPGLSDFTFDQLFYIGFGHAFCINANSDYTINIIENNEHSPEKFRVNGAVSNNEHFAKTFNCPVGSPMNPASKCLIW
eukprot:jgi/Orpsp1_1/1183719/evm.model.c7180000086409.1